MFSSCLCRLSPDPPIVGGGLVSLNCKRCERLWNWVFFLLCVSPAGNLSESCCDGL